MKRSLWLLAITILNSAAFEQPTVVQGAFINKLTVEKERQLDWLLLQVKLKVGSTIIAKAAVQADGHFSINNMSDAKANLVYGGIGIRDDVYLATILPHQPSPVKLQIELPVSSPKKHGVIKCPKCQRKDQVLPISGQAGTLVEVVHEQGDTTRLPYDKKRYYPDSDVNSWLDPHWYCVRDTIKF